MKKNRRSHRTIKQVLPNSSRPPGTKTLILADSENKNESATRNRKIFLKKDEAFTRWSVYGDGMCGMHCAVLTFALTLAMNKEFVSFVDEVLQASESLVHLPKDKFPYNIMMVNERIKKRNVLLDINGQDVKFSLEKAIKNTRSNHTCELVLDPDREDNKCKIINLNKEIDALPIESKNTIKDEIKKATKKYPFLYNELFADEKISLSIIVRNYRSTLTRLEKAKKGIEDKFIKGEFIGKFKEEFKRLMQAEFINTGDVESSAKEIIGKYRSKPNKCGMNAGEDSNYDLFFNAFVNTINSRKDVANREYKNMAKLQDEDNSRSYEGSNTQKIVDRYRSKKEYGCSGSDWMSVEDIEVVKNLTGIGDTLNGFQIEQDCFSRGGINFESEKSSTSISGIHWMLKVPKFFIEKIDYKYMSGLKKQESTYLGFFQPKKNISLIKSIKSIQSDIENHQKDIKSMLYNKSCSIEKILKKLAQIEKSIEDIEKCRSKQKDDKYIDELKNIRSYLSDLVKEAKESSKKTSGRSDAGRKSGRPATERAKEKGILKKIGHILSQLSILIHGLLTSLMRPGANSNRRKKDYDRRKRPC